MTYDDDPRPWKVLSREYLARKPWYTVRVDRVELPNGTIIPEYWVNEYRPWVNVVALTDDDQVVLIRQYRHGVEQVYWEIPAGTTDAEDTSLEAGHAPGAARGNRVRRRSVVAAHDPLREPGLTE